MKERQTMAAKASTAKRIKFPSVGWYEEVASITVADQQYQKYGRLNAIVAFKSEESIIQVNFDAN